MVTPKAITTTITALWTLWSFVAPCDMQKALMGIRIVHINQVYSYTDDKLKERIQYITFDCSHTRQFEN